MKKTIASQIQNVDRKIRWILGFSIVAFVLFLSIVFVQKSSQENSRLLVEHSQLVIKKVDTVGLLFSEAESMSRSFLIVNDSRWEKQTYQLHADINTAVAELWHLTADNPAQQQNIKKLQELCTEKEIFQVKLFSGKISPSLYQEKIHPDGEGPVISRAVKAQLRQIREIEERVLNERIHQNTAGYRSGIYTAFAGGIFSILLVLAILSQLNLDINLRKKAEKELLKSEEMYRNLIENAGAVMYTTDAIGHINFANNRVAELTGFTVEELSGKHYSILLDDSDKENVLQFYQKQFRKKQASSHLEFPILTKSGKQKWVEQSAQLLFNGTLITGFQCMVKDITERKLIEKELTESENSRKENEYRLNAILDNSTALIYIKDVDGRYVMANKKFLNLFGLTEEKLIGRTDEEISPKDLADHYKETDRTVIATLQPLETEELIDTPSGKRNLILLKFPLLTPDKKLLGVSGIATDVTENEEIRKQRAEALKKAEAAQQIQEQFLANMSHEIRTPMNGIQGMTRLLLETKLSEEQQRFTNIISRSLNNLVVIVNNVLDYSNLKTGKLTLDSFAFELTDILEEVKKYFEHQLSNKKISFEISVNKNVPHLVKGDAFRLKQVLTNLIGNAIKFTEVGGVELTLSADRQTEDGCDILFTLRDSGIGIPKDKLDTIFESFAQAGKKISSGYGGAGLGLTISKGLIEIQGGSISVESTQGKGSVFSFHIPFGKPGKEGVIASQSDYISRLSGKRVLVVEDNPVNQRLIDFVLKKVNVSVDLAANGKEAILLCEKNQPYDLIIMDLQMPVMDGYETTVYLRGSLQLNTPIIAMTATALKEDQERSAKAGMNDFMIKPFDFNDLYNRMIRLLLNVSVKADIPDIKEPADTEKLYDLSLLQELDDTAYVLEIIGFFLENTPADIEALQTLLDAKDWPALSGKAHKVKGAAGMLQAKKLAETLAAIEKRGRNQTDLGSVPLLVKDAAIQFAAVQKQLSEEAAKIKSALGEQ